MSCGQDVAKLIRKELKEKFPKVKFSVRSDYNSVKITYNDGPALNLVESTVERYEAGSFCGMEDIYTYRPNPTNEIRCKYVFVSRQISSEIRQRLELEHSYIENDWDRSRVVNKILSDLSL